MLIRVNFEFFMQIKVVCQKQEKIRLKIYACIFFQFLISPLICGVEKQNIFSFLL